jgi:hypothetical protein
VAAREATVVIEDVFVDNFTYGGSCCTACGSAEQSADNRASDQPEDGADRAADHAAIVEQRCWLKCMTASTRQFTSRRTAPNQVRSAMAGIACLRKQRCTRPIRCTAHARFPVVRRSTAQLAKWGSTA